MSVPLSYRHVALSLATSNLTGAVCFVGDWLTVSVSIETQGTAASRFTFVASNGDGFGSALSTPSQTIPTTDWSILTTITSGGIYSFNSSAGFRWLQCFRPSASSATITYTGRT